jgi:hypothetical protein
MQLMYGMHTHCDTDNARHDPHDPQECHARLMVSQALKSIIQCGALAAQQERGCPSSSRPSTGEPANAATPAAPALGPPRRPPAPGSPVAGDAARAQDGRREAERALRRRGPADQLDAQVADERLHARLVAARQVAQPARARPHAVGAERRRPARQAGSGCAAAAVRLAQLLALLRPPIHRTYARRHTRAGASPSSRASLHSVTAALLQAGRGAERTACAGSARACGARARTRGPRLARSCAPSARKTGRLRACAPRPAPMSTRTSASRGGAPAAPPGA